MNVGFNPITPTTVSIARPSGLGEFVKPTLVTGQDVSEIGGAVVGGVWGFEIGSSLGGMLGHTGAVVGGLAGASMVGNWGFNVGLKKAACVAGGSFVGGTVGNMVLGPIGGMVGSFGGMYLGNMIADKIGNKG